MVETGDAARHRDHRLLRRVERILRIAQNPPAHRVDAIDVALEQPLERGAVAGTRARRKVVVGALRSERQRPSTLMSPIWSLLDGGSCVHHTSTYLPCASLSSKGCVAGTSLPDARGGPQAASEAPG